MNQHFVLKWIKIITFFFSFHKMCPLCNLINCLIFQIHFQRLRLCPQGWVSRTFYNLSMVDTVLSKFIHTDLLNTVHFFQRLSRTNRYTPPPGGRSLTLQQTPMAFPPKSTSKNYWTCLYVIYLWFGPFLQYLWGAPRKSTLRPPQTVRCCPWTAVNLSTLTMTPMTWRSSSSIGSSWWLTRWSSARETLAVSRKESSKQISERGVDLLFGWIKPEHQILSLEPITSA